MKKNINLSQYLSGVGLLLLPLFAVGCIPEEDPIAPFDRGSAETGTVSMESDYRFQLFYDLGTGTVVKRNLITEWDIGFRSDPDGYQVVLNTAKIMAAADLGPVDFSTVPSTSGLEWKYDHQSGDWDSTAIGEWWEENVGGENVVSRRHLYVIDRGYSPEGKHLGYMKIMLLGATDGEYRFRFASLDNSGDDSLTIRRDEERNIVGFDLEQGSHVEAEPPKDQWDLLFTRYTHIFYEPTFTPYSVTGVQLNRYRTAVAVDTVRRFEEVTSEDIENLSYSSSIDVIGYNWKRYDFTAGFIIESPLYVIRDSEGFYYKLLFLDFYNTQGEKGHPTFQTQRL